MKALRKDLAVGLLAAIGALAGCTTDAPQAAAPTAAVGSQHTASSAAYPARALFGETHLHTANSGDAVFNGTRMTPEDAMRFGRGDEVTNSSGQKLRLERPLDFMLVSDHAELIGAGMELIKGNPLYMSDPALKRWHDLANGTRAEATIAATELVSAFSQGKLPARFFEPSVARSVSTSVWQDYVRTSERYNQPGKFTVLMGYEFTSLPKGNNLHRIVIFRDDADRVEQTVPFTALQSKDPERLWDYMESYEARGGQVLAIPHNGNLSNGLMFAESTFSGGELSAAYATRRQRWEPLVEVVQAKGESESHPLLSPDDAFAGFGKAGWDIGNLDLSSAKQPGMLAGEYAREALKRGLALEARLGVNPFKFGMIGAGDLHTGLSTSEEGNFGGEFAASEARADRALDVEGQHGLTRYGWQTLSGALAAVWARDNTRASIFDAMRRREVYATTGTRMSVRVFGGFGFAQSDFRRDWVAMGYARGVAMGGTLPRGGGGKAPALMIDALKDPMGANLDRVQVVKGWIDASGRVREKVYDAVWSDPARRRRDARGNVPAVGNTVDIARATYTNTIGAASLRTVWTDPHFDPAQRAFYYLRVLEIPTPRWPLYDAVRRGIRLPADAETVSQERAFTSPIWYSAVPGT